MLESQAHDSLAGCVSDTVANDIKHRLKEANEICDSIENTVMKQLSDFLNLSQNEVLVVNASSNHFVGQKKVTVLAATPNVVFEDMDSRIISSQYVESREDVLEETSSGNRFITEPGYYILELEITCELPGVGYRVFSLKESSNSQALATISKNEITGKHITIQYDGQRINIIHGNQKSSDFIQLIDEGNAGDTYDFSPQVNSEPISLRFNDCLCLADSNRQQMILSGTVQLPYTLDDRLNYKQGKQFEYQLKLTLSADDEITGEIQFVNKILNHRVRLQLATLDVIDAVKASIPYGFIERKK